MEKHMNIIWFGRQKKLRGSLLVMTMLLVQLFSLSMIYWLIDYRGMLNTYMLARKYQSYETTCYLVVEYMRDEKDKKYDYNVNQYKVHVHKRGSSYLMDIYSRKGRNLYRWHCPEQWIEK